MKRKYLVAISLVVLLFVIGLGVHILRSDAQARWPTNVVVQVWNITPNPIEGRDGCEIVIEWTDNGFSLGFTEALIDYGNGLYKFSTSEDEPPPATTHYRVWMLDLPEGFVLNLPVVTPSFLVGLNWNEENILIGLLKRINLTIILTVGTFKIYEILQCSQS